MQNANFRIQNQYLLPKLSNKILHLLYTILINKVSIVRFDGDDLILDWDEPQIVVKTSLNNDQEQENLFYLYLI